MKLINANPAARSTGLHKTGAKSNYLIGADPRRWLAGIPNFNRVKFDEVWPGIDMVYYGNQRQLEYDFVVAPGARADRIKLSFDGAGEMKIDDRGEISLDVEGREARWQKPVAWQEVNGERREVSCDYRINSERQIEFAIGRYDRNRALVIDPALVYSTYLGGAGADSALDIAVDASGAAYVCGVTASTDFPVQGAIQPNKAGGTNSDAFVAKLNASGSALVYSTYLGGLSDDTANSIAVDAAGAAYVAGETASSDFPTTAGAVRRTIGGASDGFVAKLDPNGSSLVYSTYLGGNAADRIYGLEIDSGGNVYAAGQTDSFDFPTAGATTARSGTPVFKSVNGAANWSAIGSGLTASLIQAMAADPANPNILYAASNQELYKTTDGGANWSLAGAPPLVAGVQPVVTSMAIDPKTPAAIYLGTASGVFKSVNGGQSFERKSAGITTSTVNAIIVDPMTPAAVYAGTSGGAFKSVNGGESWTPANSGLTEAPISNQPALVRRLAPDPSNPATIYAGTLRGIFKTTNGAANWSPVNNGLPSTLPPLGPDISSLAIDPSSPSSVYASTNSAPGVVFRTTNGGMSWQASNPDLSVTINGSVARFPASALAANGPAVYAGTSIGVFKSVDSGVSWSLSNNGLTTSAIQTLFIDPSSLSTVYAGTNAGSDAFVVKLNPSGSALVYSRYLGGGEPDFARGVAVDGAGAAWVTGQTNSPDFPLANPTQNSFGSIADAFVTKINADGSSLLFSTFLGGALNDNGFAIALDPSGAAYVTGLTQSPNLPVVRPIYSGLTGSTDAFVTKFRSDGSAIEYSTYLGGIGVDQGFAIAADATGAYVAGMTNSQDFPAVGALQPATGGGGDGFVTKINSQGSRLLLSTFFGGSGIDQINAIAVDSGGGVYVAGSTSSFNFPVANPTQQFRGSTDAFVSKISPSADLAVTMIDSPDPVPLSSDLTYTITVANNGELNATGVTLTDTLPEGSTLVSANTSAGSCRRTATVTCDIGNLNVSAKVTITIVIKPPARETINNTATVTGVEPDPNRANNTASQETRVTFYDLAVANSASYDRVVAGGRVYWLVSVTNLAGGAVNDVRLYFTLPARTTFVSCIPEFGVCGGGGADRTVTIASLASRQTRSVIFTAMVESAAPAGAQLTANAAVSPTAEDSDPTNNTAAASVTVTNDLFLAKANGRIAFASDRAFTGSTQPTGIYTINPDGTGETFIQATANEAYTPVWSPDGTKLAYQGYNNEGQGDAIYVVNADGTGKIKVATNTIGRSSRITWAPDSKRIAFAGAPDNLIYIANADGAGLTKLPNSPTLVRDPDWSPDGTRFAFVKFGEIYVINLDGTGQRNVAGRGAPGENFFGPRWSPDGTRILFTRQTTNRYDAFLVNADGGGLTRAFNLISSASPAWSPDGTKVVFESFNSIYVISLDGASQTRVTNNSFYNFTPHWQPLPTNTPSTPQPDTPFFSITGKVTLRDGSPFGGSLRIGGAINATIQSEEPNGPDNGVYRFVRLPQGGDYTITPENLAYRYDPPSRTYNSLNADVTGADFVATYRPFRVSGRVADSAGVGIGGVRMQLSGIPNETDANGFYSFDNVTGGLDYTLAPQVFSQEDMYEPRLVTFTRLAEDKTVNFTGVRRKYELSGLVIDQQGRGVSGVTVTLSGGANATATTDAEGKYSFGELTGGFVYSVKAEKQDLMIAPANRAVILNIPLAVSFFAGASQVAAVSAASFRPQDVASPGIVSLFGSGLSETTKQGEGLPYEIDGVSVSMTTRYFESFRAPLFSVSPQQINFLMPFTGSPFNFITGETLIMVSRNDRVIAAGSMYVEKVAPSLFTADSSGKGLAAGYVVRVKADGSQVNEPVARFDAAQNRFVAVPVDLSDPSDHVFLILFGTGVRLRSDISRVSAKIGGENAEVLYASFQNEFPGVDQVNLLLSPTLRGRGEVAVELTADGKIANTVTVNIK